jgi:hypothetical protein
VYTQVLILNLAYGLSTGKRYQLGQEERHGCHIHVRVTLAFATVAGPQPRLISDIAICFSELVAAVCTHTVTLRFTDVRSSWANHLLTTSKNPCPAWLVTSHDMLKYGDECYRRTHRKSSHLWQLVHPLA